ncbi:MAG: TolC family protein [Alphaproteobacteria bacterium]|nr:TolC family protein [Alphaproteobacteria bacterium]MCB9792877.1 TolC family protein [Alphaproteobacteria bacterium]
MLWLFLLGTAFAEDLRLGDAVDRALNHNLEQRSARLDEEQAEAGLMAAQGGYYDPRLSVGGSLSGGREPTNNALDGVPELQTSDSVVSASLSQALPGGGAVAVSFSESGNLSNSQQLSDPRTVRNRVSVSASQPLLDGAGRAAHYNQRAARLSLSDAQLGVRGQTEQLILDVAGAYWRLVAAERSLEFARISVRNTEQQLSDIRERFDEGFAGTGEVRQVEVAVGMARQDEVIAEAELQAARQALGRLIGVPIAELPELVAVDRPTPPAQVPELDAALALALDLNTTWRRQELRYERARLNLSQARNSALPDLGVSGYVGASSLGDNPAEAHAALIYGASQNVGVSADLSVALPARVDRAGLTQAQLSMDQAELALEAAREDLRLEVEAALRAVERDLLRVQLAEVTLDAAQASLAAEQELFAEGKGTTRDLVQTREALEQAQLSLLRAQIDLQSSALSLERAQGTLVDDRVVGG